MTVAINTMDQLLSALKARPPIPFIKFALTAKGAGAWQSLWMATGSPSAGSVPGSTNGIICTKNTNGAIPFEAPTLDLAVASISAVNSSVGTIAIYDRLWANGGLNGTLTTAQTFTQPALTRCTDGVGVEAMIEIYTALGTTSVTATMSYTNSDGVSGRIATASISASPVVGQLFAFILQSGDKGIRSVQSVALSATTGTAGNFGVTLAKKLAMVPLTIANISTSMDAFGIGLPEIGDDACLALYEICSSTTTGALSGIMNIVEG